MAYGNRSRAFINNTPASVAAKAAPIRSADRSWESLSEACRLALVEQTLADGFPAAL
jgi:hypothetical protein